MSYTVFPFCLVHVLQDTLTVDFCVLLCYMDQFYGCNPKTRLTTLEMLTVSTVQ